jgi:hypothetical protein
MKATSLARPVLGLIDTVRASLSSLATRPRTGNGHIRHTLLDEDELRTLRSLVERRLDSRFLRRSVLRRRNCGWPWGIATARTQGGRSAA